MQLEIIQMTFDVVKLLKIHSYLKEKKTKEIRYRKLLIIVNECVTTKW